MKILGPHGLLNQNLGMGWSGVASTFNQVPHYGSIWGRGGFPVEETMEVTPEE